MTLHRLGERPGAGGVSAVVLDVPTAGVGVAAFREMLQAEQPNVAVLELPPEHAGPEDVGLLVAALEDEIRRAERRGRGAASDDVEPASADEDHEGPVHGVKFEDLESLSPRMHALFELLPRVARSESPVLIVGETGTGKELVAAAIHRQSKRRDREFFTVNCGALTETLLESELFGHERGAFTGAVKTKKGYFELASGGTLFLDELGTISQAMQVKLLRVLETMEVRRVGGSGTLSVDVRVVAATNEDLDAAEAAYQQATEVNPEHARGWFNLYLCARQRRQLDRAVQMAARALAVDAGEESERLVAALRDAIDQLAGQRSLATRLRRDRRAGSHR